MSNGYGEIEFAREFAGLLDGAPFVDLVEDPGADWHRPGGVESDHPLVVMRTADDRCPVSVREVTTGAVLFFTFTERTPMWGAFSSGRFSRDAVEWFGGLNLRMEGALVETLDVSNGSEETRWLRDAIAAYANEEEFEW